MSEMSLEQAQAAVTAGLVAEIRRQDEEDDKRIADRLESPVNPAPVSEMSRQVRRRQARVMAKVEKRAAWLQKRREKRQRAQKAA